MRRKIDNESQSKGRVLKGPLYFVIKHVQYYTVFQIINVSFFKYKLHEVHLNKISLIWGNTRKTYWFSMGICPSKEWSDPELGEGKVFLPIFPRRTKFISISRTRTFHKSLFKHFSLLEFHSLPSLKSHCCLWAITNIISYSNFFCSTKSPFLLLNIL